MPLRACVEEKGDDENATIQAQSSFRSVAEEIIQRASLRAHKRVTIVKPAQ